MVTMWRLCIKVKGRSGILPELRDLVSAMGLTTCASMTATARLVRSRKIFGHSLPTIDWRIDLMILILT